MLMRLHGIRAILDRSLRAASRTRVAPRCLRQFAATLTISLLTLATPSAAQPVFEAVDTTNGVGSSMSIPVPASTMGSANGDLLVAVVGVFENPDTSFPAGWTPVDPGLAGFNGTTCTSDGDPTGVPCQLSIYWKFSDGTETSVTVGGISPGSPHHYVGAVLRYSGTHASMPIGPVAAQNGTGAPVAPAITTTEANTLVLRAAVGDADPFADTESPLIGGPATERFALQSTTPQLIAASVMLAASDALQPVAGGSGTAAFTGTGENWAAATVGIRPAGLITDADLSISKNDGETKVNPGTQITYTIVAANSMLSTGDVVGAAVADMFPASLTCSWECVGALGGSCTAMGVGDIADSVNLPVGATATYTAVCDIDGGASGNIMNTATITAPVDVNDTDAGNNDATDNTTLNQAPVAVCLDQNVTADASCQAGAVIDDGSNDPDGDVPLIISQAPPGPYSLGDTLVTLNVEDQLGLTDSCQATVTVVDMTDPVIACNSPATMTPPDPLQSFTATADDNCSVTSVSISSFSCTRVNGKGKLIDLTKSCKVSADGATINIPKSNGVGTVISWTVDAEDGSGNTSSVDCSIEVVNPGQN